MRSTGYGRISRDHDDPGSPVQGMAGQTAASMAAIRAAIRQRYGQWQAPGARYVALARGGIRRAERMAQGVFDEE